MERRVTLRDIAKKTGHHYSTVSLALRGELRIPAGTRARIVRAAEELGYRPDPMVQALASYRTATRPSSYHATLAWVVNDAQTVLRRDYNFRDWLDGAARRAEELGYKVEEFLLRTHGMTPDRMARMLRSRGIDGILVAPQPNRRVRARIRMDWSSFAAVSFGYTLASPALHRVTSHHSRAVRTTMRRLLSLGYRRIGLCVHRLWNARIDGGWVGGYFSETREDRRLASVEPLLVAGWEPERVGRWIAANRLDAVVLDEPGFVPRIERELGIAVPARLGAAVLQSPGGERGVSGIDQQGEEIGRSAVDLLVSLLRMNRRGLPPIAHNLMIEGTWFEGSTLRRLNA